MTTSKAGALAEEIRNQARWRWMKADEYPEDTRNKQCSDALDEAANWVEQLPDDDFRLVRLEQLRCFDCGEFHGGQEVSRVTSRWHFNDNWGTPSDLLNDIIAAAERDFEEIKREFPDFDLD